MFYRPYHIVNNILMPMDSLIVSPAPVNYYYWDIRDVRTLPESIPISALNSWGLLRFL